MAYAYARLDSRPVGLTANEPWEISPGLSGGDAYMEVALVCSAFSLHAHERVFNLLVARGAVLSATMPASVGQLAKALCDVRQCPQGSD
jgi:hypothetical protein